MHRYLLIFIILLSLFSCENNKKEYYSSGELKFVYKIKNNQLHGKTKRFYRNGILKEEAIYENGKLEGIKKVYYANGKLDWMCEYKNGKENGIFKDYSENHQLLSTSYYKKGLQDSLTIVYFSNGEIKSKSMFRAGLIHGEFKEFYEDGGLSMVATYKNDKPLFYKKYSRRGDLIEEYRQISIEFENDSIYIGEQCKAKIKIHGPLIKNIRAEIQLADSNLFKLPLKNEINIKENNYVFSVTPDEIGHFILNLRIFINSDNIYFKTADLYVLPLN